MASAGLSCQHGGRQARVSVAAAVRLSSLQRARVTSSWAAERVAFGDSCAQVTTLGAGGCTAAERRWLGQLFVAYSH